MENTCELITIHCTDTDNGYPVNLKAIEADHIKRGFSGIGYHCIIQPDGTLEQTRPINQKGAHVEGFNRNNIGVALAGKDRFTEAQFNRLRTYLDTMRVAFGWKAYNLYAHAEFQTATKTHVNASGETVLDYRKSCPNVRAADIVAWYLTNDDGPITKYLI